MSVVVYRQPARRARVGIAALCLLWALVPALRGWAQQQPQYSQYMFNTYLYNPGAAGIEDYTEARTSLRRQYVGLPEGPQTIYGTVHWALNQRDINKEELGSLPSRGASTIRFRTDDIPRKPRHGVGVQVFNDQAGQFGRTSLGASYAYHLPLGRTWYWSIGTTLGASFWRVGNDFVNVRNTTDQTLFNPNNVTTVPEIALGSMLYSDRIYVGLSAGQLAQNRMRFSRQPVSVDGRLTNHYYLTAAYRLPLTEEFDLIPSVLFKYSRPAMALDAGVKVRYLRNFWAGAQYRSADARAGFTSDAVVGLVGLTLGRLVDIGYAYDFTLSGLEVPSSGSHEIMVGLRINNRKNASPKIW